MLGVMSKKFPFERFPKAQKAEPPKPAWQIDVEFLRNFEPEMRLVAAVLMLRDEIGHSRDLIECSVDNIGHAINNLEIVTNDDEH